MNDVIQKEKEYEKARDALAVRLGVSSVSLDSNRILVYTDTCHTSYWLGDKSYEIKQSCNGDAPTTVDAFKDYMTRQAEDEKLIHAAIKEWQDIYGGPDES
jgi:threonyl-tRNA synthetase